MIKILFLILMFLVTNVYAAAPTRQYTYVPNTTIDPAENNANENALYSYLQSGVDTYAASSITGADISASASIPYVSLSLSNSIQASDIASGHILLPSGAAFFMLTGSCPSGSTDVTATYSNKFIKVNSTQGTTSGVVLTGTTDSHVLTTAELPASGLTLSIPLYTPNAGGASGVPQNTPGPSDSTSNTYTTSNMGSGNGHTHTISSASTLEPSSVTMKLCVVN